MNMCQNANPMVLLTSIDVLKVHTQSVNKIFSRNVLVTRKQQINGTIHKYIKALRHLSKNCNFQTVTLGEGRNNFIKDNFQNWFDVLVNMTASLGKLHINTGRSYS